MTATITIDPGGADERTLEAGEINDTDSVKIHTGVSDWRATVAYDTSLADLRGSTVHIEDSATDYFFRGFLIRVVDRERQGEATTQLEGLGIEHDLQRNENEKTITNQYVHDAISDYWTNDTTFSPTVTDQTADETTTGTQAQEADTDAEFSAIVTIADDIPLAAQNTNLELLQTCFTEGKVVGNRTDENGQADNLSDTDATYGESTQLSNEGAYIEYTFTTNYTIPADDFDMASRHRTDGSDPPRVEVTIDGDLVAVSDAEANVGQAWRKTSTNDWLGPNNDFSNQGLSSDLPAGTHTLRFEAVRGGTNNWIMDTFAPNDAGGSRFTPNYTFDNTLDASEGHLDGPELFPDQMEFALDRAATTWSFNSATLSTSWNDTTESQRIQLRLPPDGSWGPTDGTEDNTTSITDFDFGTDQGTAIQGRARFSAFGSRTGDTPKTGFNGQKLQSWEITFDGDDLPVITDAVYEGSDMEILQQLHADGRMRFTVEHASGTKNVESYPLGAIVKSKPDWRVISTERVHDLGGEYANHITVRGQRDSDGNRIKKTVSDSTEISNFGQEHWEEKRPEAETQTRVDRIARQVLKRHLQASDVTAEREIFSLDIEPGYSYPITQPDGTETNVPSEEVHYRVSAGDVKGRVLFNVRSTELQERLNAVDTGLRSTKLAF